MHKVVILSVLLLIMFSGSALYAQEISEGAYYYPLRYPAGETSRNETALIDDIRQEFALASSKLPALDRGLSYAARERARHLAILDPEQKKQESARDVKSWLLESGIGDDRTAAGFASASTPEKLRGIFSQWAKDRSGGGWTHLGTGMEKSGDQFIAVVILSYRPIDPAPIPMAMNFRRSLIVDGIIRNQSNFALFLSHPDGSVYMQKPTRIASGAISSEFKLRYKGTHTLQLVEIGANGPVPVATMPVEVEKASRTWTPSLDALKTAAPADLKSACLTWLNTLREKYLLHELTEDSRLDETAGRLAAEMAAGGSFAHESGSEGPRDRIERSGVRFVRFGENLAHGARIEDMIMKLWYSPSHRYNMLDEGFDIAGTGIASNDKGQWFLVQLFAESAAGR